MAPVALVSMGRWISVGRRRQVVEWCPREIGFPTVHGPARDGMRETGDRLRLLVAAFGDPGHAYPAIALARALSGRGHRVVLESWERWREAVEGPAWGSPRPRSTRRSRLPGPTPPREPRSPTGARPRADARGRALRRRRQRHPHAGPRARRRAVGLTRATLIPHVYPVHEPGLPFFAVGAHPPRTAPGRASMEGGAAGAGEDRPEARATGAERASAPPLGLSPLERFHGGISTELAMVATFPQLEYPRALAGRGRR